MRTHHRIVSRHRFDAYLRRGLAPGGARGAAALDRGRAKVRLRPSRELRARFFALTKGHRALLAAALAALAVATVLKLAPPAVVKLAIDNIFLDDTLPPGLPAWLPVPSDPKARLVALVAATWCVAVASVLIGNAGQWWALLVSRRITSRVRRRAFEHAARLPLHRVYQLRAGGAASLLREDVRCVGELTFSLLYEPCRAAVQLAGGVLMMAWVDWRLLIGTALALPLVSATSKAGDRWLRPLLRDTRRLRKEIDAAAAETFGGMKVVRAFGRSRREATRYIAGNNLLARMELLVWRRARLVEAAWRVLLPTVMGALLLYGGMQILDGRLSPGEMMMFLVYLALLAGPLSSLASGLQRLQGDLSALERVLDLLDEPCELAPPVAPLTVVTKRSVQGRITLEGVGFRYPDHDEAVLHGIDLTIEPGELVALVGPSGAGKTTLCNLIARYYDPTEGAISLDGIDLRRVPVDRYRRLLGIVEQDVFLFEGTIAENIAYADRRARPADVERAARAAHADEFIRNLPQGYDTPIGERGVRLSGGQRQRLAIARALLADPRIFILDEATSNLDGRRERLIQEELEAVMSGRTSLVIAHRLSTIQKADRILVFDRGRIIERGSHAQLMAVGGSYRQMVELQSIESSP